MKKELKKMQLLILLWVLFALAAVTAATYAWFTFSAATNVEPMSSTVSEGDITLLIANTYDGDFDTSCVLLPDSNPEQLRPISTGDLDSFYVSTAQSEEGISLLYRDVTEQTGDYLIHGYVYLQSKNGGCQVYLYRSGVGFGDDAQMLAALRLGLRVTTQKETSTYIYSLEELAEGSLQSTQTIPQLGTVVSGVSQDGAAVYISDPALNIGDFFATERQNSTAPEAGNQIFTTLQEGEIATVEYWLYLEGCDEHCMGAVQNRDFTLQLAFAGVKAE
jgi:hypothetical protein